MLGYCFGENASATRLFQPIKMAILLHRDAPTRRPTMRPNGAGMRERRRHSIRKRMRAPSGVSSPPRYSIQAATGEAMDDWFHELPVAWMALFVYGLTYLLALVIHAGVG